MESLVPETAEIQPLRRRGRPYLYLIHQQRIMAKPIRSGELRNGSSLHAGFYDLTLFFPVSSFILILDRCV